MSSKFSARVLVTALLFVSPSLWMTSCQTPPQHGHRVVHHAPSRVRNEEPEVNHGARNAGMTAGGITFMANMLAGNNIIDSAIRGTIAGVSTYTVLRVYEASAYQQQVAYDRGSRAIRRTVVRQRVQSSGARVVAVRVPKRSGQQADGSNVMLVHASSGKPVSDKAYVVKGDLKDGGDVDINGTRAVFSADVGL